MNDTPVLRRFRWRYAGGGVVCLLLLGVLIFPQVQQARMAARRMAYKRNLQQISLGLHAYHDEYHCFPPAHVRGPDGKRWHSWRVLILPYIGQQELYAKYHFDEPWNSPSNSELIDEIPALYCLSNRVGELKNETSILAVVGKRAAFPAEQSLRIRDFMDGTSNTILLMESDQYRAVWSAPDDISPREVFADEHLVLGRHAVMGDGAVRFLLGTIDDKMLRSLLTPSYGSDTYTGEWPADLIDEVPLASQTKRLNLSTIPGVDISPIKTITIQPDQTLLWCATFQMAWDQMCRDLNVDELVERTTPHSTIGALNSHPFPLTALDTDAYSLNTTHDPVQEIWKVHAKLHKQMPFENQFARMELPLKLEAEGHQHHVHSFGCLPESNGVGTPHFQGQVQVVDYESDENFILKLRTISPANDEIILARLPQPAHLQAAINEVQQRTASPNRWHDRPDLMTGDELRVPVLLFHFLQEFTELVDEELSVRGVKYTIQEASQSLFLSLDEKGAEVLSLSEFAVIGEFGEDPEEPPPVKPRKFIFDKPFLMILKEKDATEPYFAGWLASPKLMQPW